ncbi:stage III sporulation protein AE [Ruminiclostridium sufflavum DSM 19573]|uniref:Stage III sporulation protein AE n=1 Tax=Ruminiclostridium sufflavum DSM 19573 TaxID=1121337 RepID=A0A318XKC6_9FIRM|nr:stage III sporulation protein AE [Ruminiclostridium sufflavum]PYG86813.1 stage III sporulation protein AE [Ruminiclostridium sufflavum DSM 19573]
MPMKKFVPEGSIKHINETRISDTSVTGLPGYPAGMPVSCKYALIVIAVLILAIFASCPVNIYAAASDTAGMAQKTAAEEEEYNETGSIIDEQLNSGDTKSITESVKKYYAKDSKELFPEFNPDEIAASAVRGDFDLSLTGIFNRIVKYLFNEVLLNVDILIKIIILAIICAILKNLQSSFLSESVGELAFFVCYIVIVSVLIVSFSTAMSMCVSIIDSMVAFMHSIIPLLISLLISTGNISSAGIFQPILIVLVETGATVIKSFFIPMIFLITVLNIVNNISDKVQLTKLSGFLKQICTWGIGLILTVFIAVVSIQGTMGAVVDGVTSKTAKFALGTFIPVVGKYLADAADTVVGCTLVIKNASGLIAMLGIIIICLAPLLKILALIILYRLACAIVEPISDKKITNCLSDMAGSLTFLLGITAAVSCMFLIAVTVVIGTTNLSTMIR